MIEIIPAIDIIEGKCVRLSKGDYSSKKVYNENPVEVAVQFQDYGIKRLHVVDLDGAKEQHVVNWKVLEQIALKTNLKIDFGGGIKSDSDIDLIFNSGAHMATIGSIAVKNRDLFFKWVNQYGTEKIILGADVNNRNIAVSGWLEVTELDIVPFLDDYIQKGIKQVLCTDISKDGMLGGSSVELYREIKEKFLDIQLIASGGVSGIDEINTLNAMKITGVIIGKAIYEGKINLNDLKIFLG